MSDPQTTGTQKLSPIPQAGAAPQPPAPRTRALIAADKTINGDRQQDYGEVNGSFLRISQLWSAILGVAVQPHEVALMMAALKISRAIGKPDHVDSYVDLLGYGALAAELAGVSFEGQQ